MSRYIITVNNTRHVVDVVQTGPDEYAVTVDGTPTAAPAPLPAPPVPAAAPTPAQAPAAPASAPVKAAAASGGHKGAGLTAPMPGTVDSILVEVGQTVSKGDTLLVLEAMKMKNDLKSNTHGTIASIEVAPGQQVKFGETLITFA